jgi:phospholipid/cholesterol/gamma-HCH transport system substrate-binding protein
MRAPTNARVREFQVGAFVLLGFFAISMFSFRLTETPAFAHGTQVVTYLDDATGLFQLAKVKQAGISIGFVKSIELVDGRAKVTLVIEKPYSVPKDARVVPRPLGILGDKYLEIVVPTSSQYERYRGDEGPTPASPGAPVKVEDDASARGAPSRRSDQTKKIENGAEPPVAYEVQAVWGQALARVSDWIVPSAVAQSAAPVPAASKPAVQGDVLKSSNSAATVDDITRQVGEVTKDLQATSKSLKTMIEKNTDDVDRILGSWARISTKIETILNGVNSNKVEKDIRNLSNAAGNMSQSLANIESITGKLDRGEGTLGKLINDPSTIEEINRSLVTINNAIDRANRIQSIVDLRSQYGVTPKTAKTYVGVRIMTRESSGYVGEIVLDPAGTEKKVITTVRTNGGSPVVTETLTNDRTALKYSLQFYKRIADTAFRLGLFESTGGVGADFQLFRRRLQATVEFFELGRERDNPNLKIWFRVPFLDYLYAEAGGDDLITKVNAGSQRRTFFVGLGLNFTDQDLKTLFIFSGIP